MEVQRSRFNRIWMGASFIFLSMLSFYCCCYRLPVGVKYAINLIVLFWAFVDFLVHPRMEDMKYCLRFVALFGLTYIIPWLWSSLIWIYRFRSFDYIVRGSLNTFYMLTTVAFVGASFYLFGLKSIPYLLISMMIANGLVYLEVGKTYGFDLLMQQHLQLILSFADNTGKVVRKMELHDIVFGWGIFILYYAMQPTRIKWHRWAYLAISLFFFTVGFKRIGVMAVALALVIGVIYQKLSEDGKRIALRVNFIIFLLVAFGYIVLVRSGLFYQIADALNVNLMGRKAIYSAYEDFYELSPFFTGQGTRFIYQYGTTVNGVDALHNDLLGLYIEVGFFVWLLWMWYEFYYRANSIGRRYSYQASVNIVACSVYLYITFMTDNTFYYFPANALYRITVMAWCCQKYHSKTTEEGLKTANCLS